LQILKDLFLKEDGGKKALNKKSVVIAVFIFFLFGVTFALVPKFLNAFRGNDTSKVTKTTSPITEDGEEKESSNEIEDNSVGGVSDASESSTKSIDTNQTKTKKKQIKVIYQAGQVINRQNDRSSKKLPLGTNVIAKLITSIDTRNPSLIKVILPYDAKNKSGEKILPKGSILIGELSYSGQGNRVFISFTKAVLTDDNEIDLHAQALSSKDYSAGIEGEFHSNTVNRVGSVLGLSMISGTTEVLVEKESLGEGQTPTPKSTIKNGLINGLSKIANMEANMQAQKLATKPEYVTIEAGSDLIIGFFSFTKGGN
jgi:type IV secretory pathway VirB10-like protein